MASSAAEVMFEVGALTTIDAGLGGGGDVHVVQADTGAGDDLSLLAAAMRLGVTWVAERTRIASASAMAASSSARSAPLQCRISKSGPRASTVAGDSSSAIRTTGLADTTGFVTTALPSRRSEVNSPGSTTL